MLSAAYTRTPLRGSIFVEGELKPDLIRFLRRAPGIKKRNGDPITKFLQLEERVATLTLPKERELRFVVGQWVRVKKGTYKGDIGYVKQLMHWGGVQLLLVPRL